MASKLKILFVEDVPTDVELAKRTLTKEGIKFLSRVVETEPDFLRELEKFVPDIIISDYQMPEFDGMRGLKIVVEKYPHIPFIVLTGSMNEETAVECMRTGAVDYVIKEHISRLPFAVKEVIEQTKVRVEKEKTEEDLRSSEKMMNQLIQGTQAMLFAVNRRGLFTFVNRAGSVVLGLSHDQLVGNFYLRMVHPDDRKRVHTHYLQQLEKGIESTYLEFRHLDKNHSIRWISFLVNPINENGNVVGLSGIARDITERKRNEEALKESERILSTLVGNLPGMSYRQALDRKWTTHFISLSSYAITGYYPEDFIDNKTICFNDIIVKEFQEPIWEKWQTVLADNLPFVHEYQIRKADGEIRWVWERGLGVYDDDGNVLYLEGYIEDITERKIADEKLKTRLELEYLISNISTDFINLPANNIDKAINAALGKIGSFASVDRSYMFMFSEDLKYLNNTHEWCAEGINPEIDNLQELPDSVFPWLLGKLEKLETINIPNVAELGEEAKAEKGILEPQGIKSVVLIPMASENKLIGFLGFDSVRQFKIWAEEDIVLLKTMSEIFVNALKRINADEELGRSEEKYRLIVENSHDGIEISQDDKIIYANKQFAEMLGYTVEEIDNISFDEIHTEQSLIELYERQRKRHAGEKTPNQYETTFYKKDDSVIHVKVNFVIIDYSGKPATFATIQDLTEQKLAEENLKLSEHTYRGIINSITEAVYILNNKGEFLDVNDAAEIMYGYTREYFVGKTPEFVSAPGKNDLQKTAEQIGLAFAGELQRFEFWGLRKDGSIFPKIVCLSKGTYFGEDIVIAVGRDITDRKIAEDALRESEERFRNLVEDINDIFFVADKDGKLTYCSPNFYTKTGFSTTEIIGNIFLRIVAPIDRKQVMAQYQEAIKTGIIDFNIEFRTIFKDGSIIWVEQNTRLIRNSEGKVIEYRNVVREITERKLAEELLRESEERFRNLVEDINDIFFVVNADGKISYCSPNFFTQTGFSQHEIYGSSFLKLVSPVDRKQVLKQFEFAQNSGVIDLNMEFRANHKDGTLVWVEQNTRIVRDDKGDLVLFRNVVRDISERKHTEKALRESEYRYQTLAEASPVGIFRTDADGITTYVNPRWCQISGLSADKAMGNGWLDGVHPDDREMLFSGWGEATSNKRQSIAEYRFLRPDGTIAWVMGQAVPEYNPNNQIVGYVGTVTDITALKNAELELQKGKEELLKFFEDDISADLISTPEGRLIYCNKTYLDLFGFKSLEEAQNYPIDKLYINPPDRVKFLDNLNKFKKLELYEDELITLDGRKIITIENSTGIFDEEGNLLQIRSYLVDITKLKDAEKESKKLSRAVEQSSASVIITDPNGIIEYVNEKLCELTGYTKEELLGKNPSLFKSGLLDDGFYADLWNTILSGKNWKGEMLNKKKNGELFWESARISPLVNEQGNITHFVAVQTDITEKKKMLDDLIVAKELAEQSNKLKDAFIANMSHEIRTPLNGLLGMTSILKEAFVEHITENEEVYFSGIRTSSSRIIRTVDMILNYSQLQAGSFNLTPKTIDINTICSSLHNEFKVAASKRSLKLTFENRCDNTTIVADEFSITQSISNLIDNAIKYTNVGFVEVILFNDSEGNILLDVADSGIGISDDYLEHLFEPYRQEEMGYGRAYEGVGLGLSLVRNFLVFNNASISLKSKKGEGSTFTINFGKASKPTKDEQAKKVEISESQPIFSAASTSAKGDKHIVLLVEDDDLNKLTTKLFLGNKFKTLTTDSSDEVIEILKSNKVDIILMDVSIRGKLNGLELTTELKEMKEFSAIPIIAVTAHAFESDRKNALDAGCDDYLSKPFTKEEILLKISKLVS